MASKRSVEFQREIRDLIEALESDTITSKERIRVAEILLKNTSDNQCLVKAEDNAPIFVLIPTDKAAIDTIIFWSDIAHGVHEVEKIDDARKVAVDILKWRQQRQNLCVHAHLNEEGICRACGADYRSGK